LENHNNKKDIMNEEFKNLLLETLCEVQKHEDGEKGVAFVTGFDEEPDWEVAIVFRPKKQ